MPFDAAGVLAWPQAADCRVLRCLVAGGGSFGDIYLGKKGSRVRIARVIFRLQLAPGQYHWRPGSQRCYSYASTCPLSAGTNIQTGEEVAIKLVSAWQSCPSS